MAVCKAGAFYVGGWSIKDMKKSELKGKMRWTTLKMYLYSI